MCVKERERERIISSVDKNVLNVFLNERVLAVLFSRERHSGGIAPGWKVAHRNGVTVDDRMENLQLVPLKCSVSSCVDEPARKNRDQSLYWLTVQQLQGDPLEEVTTMFVSCYFK